ncbi:NAC domain-containing protein 82-like isoform X1 [Senna tora]|uniref:NAC domain-containing protein 82-like isoform X1 n=1 Tax=Senna tora TaxID=362788 RepID=A0A835CHA4_9FABA|nr:NAC domain-containing protein 82-like isoform X1 [Senna tora]
MATTKLIPGFRFHPTDVELLKYFLKRKVMGKKFFFDVIAEVDIYKYAPWDLPDKSCLRTGDLEWYFFSPREKKYANGARIKRATEVGAPKGERTDWVMHEYILDDKDLTDKGIPQDSYVLCKVFQKEGPGPRNGAQYGKPFNEEDWDNDEEVECVDSIPLVDMSASSLPILPITHHSSVAIDKHPPASGCIGSPSVSCLTGVETLSTPMMHPSVPSNKVISNDGSLVPIHDDIASMLDCFTEDDSLALNGNKIQFLSVEAFQLAFCLADTLEKIDDANQKNNGEEAPGLDVNDIFKDLGDIGNWGGGWEDKHDYTNQMFPTTASSMSSMGWSDSDFLELLDLEPFDPQKQGKDRSSINE